MSLIELVSVPRDELSDQQRQDVLRLEGQFFGDVDPKEGEECFYAEVHARILAYSNKELVGCLVPHKRNIELDGREILVGGAVGACVVERMRERGIGKRLMKKGLAVLKEQGCDVTCLNVDPENRRTAFKLYKKLGFKLMER